MKAMTYQEREEIRGILRNWRDARMCVVTASDSDWKNRIEERKRKIAIGKLKVEKDVQALSRVEDQIDALEKQKAEIEARITAKMPKERAEGYRKAKGCAVPKSLCDAVNEIAETVHHRVMKGDATGRKVLEIEADHEKRLAKLATCTTREDVRASKIVG